MYDVLIIGAGPAGCACAYIASKLGLKTALIEKNNYLGGLMTGGLVVPVMKTDSGNINVEFYNDLILKAKAFGAQIEYFDENKGWFDPNLLKIVLDDMLNNKNLDIYFESNPVRVVFENKFLKGVEISSNMLSLYIEAKYFVDSTGDSKIFQLLNEKFFDDDNKKQPSSLRFIMSGVNKDKFKKFLFKHDKDRNVTNSCTIDNNIYLTSAYTWDNKNWGLESIFNEALKNGDLEPFDTAYFQVFSVAGNNDSIAFNCPRLRDYNPYDPLDYSKAIMEAREAIFRLSKFMIKYFDGFQKAYISQIADMTGIRESNKVISKKPLTSKILFSDSIPDNPVLKGDYPVDIHSNDKNDSTLSKRKIYYMGIDSLKSKNYKNLFAAGRNLGADKIAQSALRTQSSCMSMGEGVARYIFDNVNNCKN